MESKQSDILNQLREKRIAKEKARIDKLREMNLKKYSKNEPQSSVSNTSVPNKPQRCNTNVAANKTNGTVKNIINVKHPIRRPSTAPSTVNGFKKPENVKNVAMKSNNSVTVASKSAPTLTSTNTVKTDNSKSGMGDSKKPLNLPTTSKSMNLSRKSMASSTTTSKASEIPKPIPARKSFAPPKIDTTNNTRQSVFERLYKPKPVTNITKPTLSNAVRLHTDPNYLKKVIRDSNLLLNKRHTVFETKASVTQPVRRSISAVHLKKISKKELSNCIHKWASIGEKLDSINPNEVNEDECVQTDKVVSAIKSERKKVKFQTPVPHNFNTPTHEELQSRLQSWLQKRGKSLDSFHHIQCFGLHHLKGIKPLEAPKFDLDEDENKENVPLESDSDDDSYNENVHGTKDLPGSEKVDFNKNKWRRASCVSDSLTEYNESTDTITSSEIMPHVDELLLGALNDLTQLLKEGFDWEQCARYLRAIRDRYPSAPDAAAYWECRAALEERRGDLPASVQCWEEAIAMGTKRSVVESNLDQLLDKFLQLRISPGASRRRQPDPKMVDVRNVFKSTIIRFAVQQAKLRQSNQSDQPKYTVTPVRRSARLSVHARATPLRVCASVRQACEEGAQFRPNRTLSGSP